MKSGSGQARRGAAAVEFALAFPVLILLFAVAVDFPRIFFYSVTLTNCARQGALFASDSISAGKSPYASITAAALADATNLTPQPTVASTNGTDAAGHPYVEVTVSWQFSTVTTGLVRSGPITLNRKVRMRAAPVTPG